MRDLVQQVAEGHKNSKAAKEKLQKLKQSIGMPSRYKSCESLTVFFPDHQSSFPRFFSSERSFRAEPRAPPSSARGGTGRA